MVQMILLNIITFFCLSMHCCNPLFTLFNLYEYTFFKQALCTTMPHCLVHPSHMGSQPPTLQLVPIHIVIIRLL